MYFKSQKLVTGQLPRNLVALKHLFDHQLKPDKQLCTVHHHHHNHLLWCQCSAFEQYSIYNIADMYM